MNSVSVFKLSCVNLTLTFLLPKSISKGSQAEIYLGKNLLTCFPQKITQSLSSFFDSVRSLSDWLMPLHSA